MKRAASLENPLFDALLAPLDQLRGQYEDALVSMSHLVSDLSSLRDRTAGNGDDTGSASAPLATAEHLRPIEVRLSGSDFGQLLSLQQYLSVADGVVDVAITGVESGRATLLVTMTGAGPETGTAAGRSVRDEAPPTLICAWCEAVMSVGGSARSHGLCAACAEPFMTGNQR